MDNLNRGGMERQTES